MKVVIFGGNGLVGSRFIELNKDFFQIVSPTVEQIDILDKDKVTAFLEESNCDSVINFAAFTSVEGAEDQKGGKEGVCFKVNVVGARNVAEACKSLDKHLTHISTDYVFDGFKSEGPYTEEDKPNPVNWYGQTKYLGEVAVLEGGGKSVVVRICMPFSAHYEPKKDIARFFLSQLKAGNPITGVEDQRITPTLVDDIANALKVITDAAATGIYHISSTTYTSPLEFAKLIASVFNFDNAKIEPVLLDEYNRNKKAQLLKYSWLSPSKFTNEFSKEILHTIEEAVRLFSQQII